MIGQFAKRPASKHKSNLRPITGQASEQSKRQSNECFEMAKQHMKNKEYDQALKHYTNATIHNPSNFKALCNMGTIYKEKGKFPQARSCYHKALFSNPFDPITLYNLANLQRVLGDDDLAIAIYTKVTHLKQGQNMDIGSLYYDAYLNQGICYKNLQLYDQAITCSDKAIQISPNDQSAYFNKSMCLLKKIYALVRSNFISVKKKLCQQAETTFKKVLGINPNNFTAKMGLIQLKYLQEASEQNLNDAVKEFQVLQKSAPESQKFELSLKIKYCKNELRKIDQSKIILPPKKDIIEVKDTVNKYDNQPKQPENKNNKPVQNKRPESKKQSSAQNKREKKQPQQIPAEIKQQLDQGQSLKSMIDKLIQEKRFQEAFDLTQKMPDGMEKYETQIIINYGQCVEEENDAYLESAISIYNDFVIKNDENTPITKELCSEKAHEIIATMLTVYGIFEQASKHYEVLLQIVQDQKFNKAKQQVNKQKLREIHAELGICYAERGLLQEAINEYRKSLEMQPDNYFLMTNLCGLLIQDGHNAEARKYYQNYLAKNGGENMTDKVAYVDSLLNISISVRDTEEQWQAINRAVQAVQKYFPTIDNIKENLHQEAILGLYLRQVQIFEQKAETLQPSSPQKRELYEKMLDAYLTCLEFENCPDREAICINSGILFYLNGCYANALSFYKNVVVNKKVIANNVALTLLHMHEYERGANWLQIAIEDSPENVVYAANFEIVKWMCGMGDRIIQKYNCQCESMYETRVLLGLWMIDELTLMIDQNQIDVDYKKGSKTPIKGQVDHLIDILLQKAENSQKLEGRSAAWKSKSTVITKKLNNHLKQLHSGQQGKAKQLISNDVLDLSLKLCKDRKQFQENFTKVLDYLSSLKEDCPQFSIIQCLFSLPLLVNNHIPDLTEITKAIIEKKQIHNTTKVPEMLESAEFKQAKIGYIQKKVQIDDPTTQLIFKTLQTTLQDAECILENAIEYFLERIQNSYYSNPDNLLSPLNKEYTHPHCDNSLMCIRCVIGTSHLYSSIFAKRIKESVKVGKNWTTKQQIQSFNEALHKFTEENLQKESNNVFSKNQGVLTVRLEQKQYPIILKAHFKTFQNAGDFLKSVDKSFTISGEEKSQKGVRLVQINKSLMLELFWGQGISALDRFCHWISTRSTNYVHDSVLFLGEELKELQELFQQGPKSIEKIKTSLYAKP